MATAILPVTPLPPDIEFIDLPRGITLSLPGSGYGANVWEIERIAEETVISHTSYPNAEIRQRIFAGVTAEKFIAEMEARARTPGSGLTPLKPREVMALSGASQAFSITFSNDSKKMLERLIVYSSGTDTGAIFFQASESDAEALKPIFAQVLQSIKIEAPREGAIGVRWQSSKRDVWAPNSSWDFSLDENSIQMKRFSSSEQVARVYIHPVVHNKQNLETAYAEHKQEALRGNPGAQIISDHQAVTLSGNVPGLSITQKNPATLILRREIVFLHNYRCNELGFSVVDAEFQNLKPDLSWIVQSVVLR